MKRFLLIKKFIVQLPKYLKVTFAVVVIGIVVIDTIAAASDLAFIKQLAAFFSTIFIIQCAVLLHAYWHKWRKDNPQITGP